MITERSKDIRSSTELGGGRTIGVFVEQSIVGELLWLLLDVD